MTVFDKVRFVGRERADVPDMVALSDKSSSVPRAVVRRVISGDAGYVLEPFSRAIVGPVFTVTKGVAIAADLASGTPDWGQVLADGGVSKNVNFTGKATGTYDVAVKFVYSQGDYANRAFWNADTTSEDVVNIPTREKAEWDAQAFATGTAPAGWVLIETVAWDAGTSVITGQNGAQDMLFEGVHRSPILAPEHTWGDGAGDRSQDRLTNGVRTLRGFARAVIRQVADVIGVKDIGGTTKWFAAVPISLSDISGFLDVALNTVTAAIFKYSAPTAFTQRIAMVPYARHQSSPKPWADGAGGTNAISDTGLGGISSTAADTTLRTVDIPLEVPSGATGIRLISADLYFATLNATVAVYVYSFGHPPAAAGTPLISAPKSGADAVALATWETHAIGGAVTSIPAARHLTLRIVMMNDGTTNGARCADVDVEYTFDQVTPW